LRIRPLRQRILERPDRQRQAMQLIRRHAIQCLDQILNRQLPESAIGFPAIISVSFDPEAIVGPQPMV
jgi:hypothetical protein